MSTANNFQLIGRLTKNPIRFDNPDGSVNVKYTIAIDRSFTTREGKREADFIPVQTYISAEKTAAGKFGAFPYLGAGDQIAVTGEFRSYTSTKNGETTYGVNMEVKLADIEMLESRATTQARRANAEQPAQG